MMKKEFPVLITVDVCDGSFDAEERKQRFNELMALMPAIRDHLIDSIGKSSDRNLPATWFIRADMQVKDITGNAMGLFHGWRDFWNELTAMGSEIAWHPHLYKRRGRKWIPIRDPKQLKSEADKIWHEIANGEWKFTSCRMGESVGSNELMKFLDSIGMIADSTAVPGRFRNDVQRWFDWEATPDEPYHPADGDCRRPSQACGMDSRVDGESSLRILEIPFTMAPIRAPYDDPALPSGKIRRYIDLSYDPALLKKGLQGIYRKANYLVCVVHPMQASGREVPDGGLVVGGPETLKANLREILKSIRDAGRIPVLMTMSEFAKRATGIDSIASTDKAKNEEKQDKPAVKTRDKTVRQNKKTSKPAHPDLTAKVRVNSPPPRQGPRKRQG